MTVHQVFCTLSRPYTAYPVSQFFPPGKGPTRDAGPLSASGLETAGGKRRALVVDDVADVTDMLAVLLTHAGYDVTTAASAAEALTAARNQQFDVIISDIGMPNMNGYQLAREIRALPDYETTPMVAVTGYSMFNDRQQSLNAGFTAHMTKPIDPRALLELIEQL